MYEFYGIDARYGHYCTPQVPIISNPEPCYDQDYDEFPKTLLSFPQQYPCCEDCGGPYEDFPMFSNRDYYEPNPCYDSNYSGFDQIEPPQSPVIHQAPQETNVENFQVNEDLMISIETFLKKFNRISFRETPKVLLQAWDKILEIKHREKQHPPEDVQDLLRKFLEDVQNISEELAEYINSPSWNRPAIYYDDDDDERPVDSLIMEDEHLDTIPETESHEFIKSNVEDLVQIPNESEDSSDGECDLPPYDDSSKNHDLTFSNPLFDIDEDFTSKITSIRYFDNDSQKIDSRLDEFVGELTLLHSIPPGIVGSLAPRFVGPFEIIEKVGPMAYRLDLPEKLNGVHDTFHVSNLKKCLADPTLQVPLDEIQVDAKLNFVEEPVFSTWMAFGGIHVTWAHLEKKRTRLRTYTKSLEELCIQSVEAASQAQSDAIAIYLVTTSGRNQLISELEDSIP
ncbi:hypothetical protein Tco_0924345 [Tanacetum coccineum]|uniref:Tf2-1-like SH3-like domain-containing protein n=1 Tax=Tanacetum coccineum TaxID=301880 RepID=A0ABQ5D3K8_9ASTR